MEMTEKKKLYMMAHIFMMTIFIYVCSLYHVAEAVNEDHCINGLYLARNLARKEPVENILFAHVGDDSYECFKMDGSGTSRKAVIYHVPFNTPIATYTLYEYAAKELVKELEYSDYMAVDGCRYPYVVCKPLIIFSLRVNDAERGMRFYRILSTESDEWKEYLPYFLTVAEASDGTLTFDWRLVYQVAFSKESASSPVHQVMDYIDGISDERRMAKQYLSAGYLVDLLDDWYRHNPGIAQYDWNKEYRRTLESKEYNDCLEDVNRHLADVMDKFPQ